MAENSKIEWTDTTWNPVTGCTPVSPGCTNCYAAQLAATRLKHLPAYEGLATVNSRGQGVFNGTIKLHEDKLILPLKWRKPRRIFVNSMSDLFHESVPFEFIDKVFAVMALCPQHTFQVLTKRPERMAEYTSGVGLVGGPEGRRVRIFNAADGLTVSDLRYDDVPWPLPNVWLGTSVENQETADQRIPHLQRCPAAVRFLSCEPLLSGVDIAYSCFNGADSFGELPGIHLVIVGGESGPNARPMHPDWARSLRDQCVNAGVPFFFKQWGEWVSMSELIRHDKATVMSALPSQHSISLNGDVSKEFVEGCCSMYRVGKARAGRLLDGREWNEFPEALR